MRALLWETEWSEILLQFCHMMGKSIQAPVVQEDSGEGDRGAGVSTCCLTRLQLFSVLFQKQRLCSLLLPPLTGFRASFHISSLLCDVWWHTCLRAKERLLMSPSDRSVSTDSSPIKHKNQSRGNTMHACQGGKIFCFNLKGITMASRVIFYSLNLSC